MDIRVGVNLLNPKFRSDNPDKVIAQSDKSDKDLVMFSAADDLRIAARGRKAVLESRRSAHQFHATSRFQITSRDFGFRVANSMINSRFRRRKAAAAGVVPQE